MEGLLGLDARPVDQEGVVEDVELVVEGAELVALDHLVGAALPGQPLVIQRLLRQDPMKNLHWLRAIFLETKRRFSVQLLEIWNETLRTLDRVAPVDYRPSCNKLHPFVPNKNFDT